MEEDKVTGTNSTKVDVATDEPHAPTKEEQKEIVNDIVERANKPKFLKENHTYYLVAAPWLKVWKKYIDYQSGSKTSSRVSAIDAEEPGTINNSALLDEDGELKKTVYENDDFEVLNEELWNTIVKWYGGGPVIARKCITRRFHQPQVDLRRSKIQVIWSRQPKTIVVKMFSKSTTIREFLTEMKKEMKFNIKNVRVWDFHNTRKLKLLTEWDKAFDECNIMDGQHMLIEEQKKDKSWPSDKIYPSHSHQVHHSPSPAGQTGLQNLGNTCFMNSGLQCLAATAPLAEFFLSGNFEQDINEVNPLGTKGEMSRAFASLMQEIWSSAIGVATPREMKNTIQRFAPQFSGYQQHDSQELLAFLLDGLHEDLNRIKKKPYVEYVNGWSSEEAWNIGHKQRNDSIIVDLFQGQLKSRLRCPLNEKVYDQYDPFMYLTVPLPVQNVRKISVTVYRADATADAIKYRVTIEKDGTVRDLKVALSKLTGIDANHLITVDVHMNKFHREFIDREPLDEILENDHVAAHEILISETQKEKENSDDDSDDDSDDSVDDSEDYVRILLYQKINPEDAYVHKEFFGTPLILSIRKNITYRELYKTIIHRLSGGKLEPKVTAGCFKVVPFWQVQRDEQHFNKSQKAGRISSDLQFENSPRDEEFDESIRGLPRFEDDTVFELIPTNAKGDDRDPQPHLLNDDQPLKLKDRQTICCYWLQKHMNYYLFSKSSSSSAYEIEVKHDPETFGSKLETKKASLTLDDCLRAFAAEEQLSSTDTWYCGECKEHVQAYKKFSISRLPKILVVHLKRFSYRGQMSRERIDDVVLFPINDFDTSEFVEEKGQNMKYDLFAISNHYGSLGGGHYTAFVKGRSDNQWYKCDDSSVSRCDASQIVTEAAYVLFYVRQDVEWPAFVETKEKEKEDSNDDEDGNEGADEYEEEGEEESVPEAKMPNNDNGDELVSNIIVVESTPVEELVDQARDLNIDDTENTPNDL